MDLLFGRPNIRVILHEFMIYYGFVCHASSQETGQVVFCFPCSVPECLERSGNSEEPASENQTTLAAKYCSLYSMLVLHFRKAIVQKLFGSSIV